MDKWDITKASVGEVLDGLELMGVGRGVVFQRLRNLEEGIEGFRLITKAEEQGMARTLEVTFSVDYVEKYNSIDYVGELVRAALWRLKG